MGFLHDLRWLKPPSASRAVECGKVFPLKEFLALTKLGAQGLREAKADGLRVVYLGKSAYVRGDDWHDFLGGKGRSTERWSARDT